MMIDLGGAAVLYKSAFVWQTVICIFVCPRLRWSTFNLYFIAECKLSTLSPLPVDIGLQQGRGKTQKSEELGTCE